MEDKLHHHQVADKAFEDKSHEALVRYLKQKEYSYRELDRKIMIGKDTIAEWDGIFELENGEIGFRSLTVASSIPSLEEIVTLKTCSFATPNYLNSKKTCLFRIWWRPQVKI